jgi:two-component system LytT family sensor kinase
VRANLSAAVAVLVLLAALGAAVYGVVRLRARRGIATATQRATYEVLHTAGQAAEPFGPACPGRTPARRYGTCAPWSARPAWR